MYQYSQREIRTRYSDLIVLFFQCRKEKGVKECSKCDFWSETEEHFKDCPEVSKHEEARKMSRRYKNILAIEELDLPASIRLMIFPDKAVKAKKKRQLPLAGLAYED